MNLQFDYGESLTVTEDFPLLENEFDEMGGDSLLRNYAFNSEQDDSRVLVD